MLRFEDVPEINSERWLSLENLEDEEWRDIDEAKGSFMISNYGRIKALPRIRKNHYSEKLWKERIRRLGYNKKGYPIINLTVDGKSVLSKAVHVLVAKAFIQNVKNKPQIDHINAIRTDNRVCNLRWATAYENAHNPITETRVTKARAKQIGAHYTESRKQKISQKMKGEKNHMYGRKGKYHPRSIPVIQLTINGDFVKEWECARAASKIYGSNITNCCKGHRNQCGGYKWEYKNK